MLEIKLLESNVRSATLFEIGFNDWIAKVMFEVHNELV